MRRVDIGLLATPVGQAVLALAIRQWDGETMLDRLRKTHAKAWFVPLVYAAAALTSGVTVARLANVLLPGYTSTVSANAAIGIYSAIASGMLALTGIVFSLTFVMVQFSATAYSPRLVLWIARDPVISHATGVFTATFLYAWLHWLGSTVAVPAEFRSWA
jgi:uncharacterized membrane protein